MFMPMRRSFDVLVPAPCTDHPVQISTLPCSISAWMVGSRCALGPPPGLVPVAAEDNVGGAVLPGEGGQRPHHLHLWIEACLLEVVDPHAVGAVHLQVVGHGVGAAAGAHVDDLGEMELPGVAETLFALARAVADAHRIAGETLLAEHRLRQPENRGVGDEAVTGSGTRHQRANPARTAEPVQAVGRGVDEGAHLGHELLAVGCRHGVLYDHEPMPVERFENVCVEGGFVAGLGGGGIVEALERVLAEGVVNDSVRRVLHCHSTRHVSSMRSSSRRRLTVWCSPLSHVGK